MKYKKTILLCLSMSMFSPVTVSASSPAISAFSPAVSASSSMALSASTPSMASAPSTVTSASMPAVVGASDKHLTVDEALGYCHQQVKRALKELSADGQYDFSKEPRNILANDRQKGWNLRPATAEEWCSGFWPGILWMDYMASKDTSLLRVARGYTESLLPIVNRPVYDHDLGFLINCSYGKGYAATGNPIYKKVLLRAADSLATLFNPVVGTMLSWPREVKRQGWPHNTIMDNMMNLELLFWASRNGGNPLLYDLAVAHAKTTMQHQFRPDGTCYHVAVYDTITGDFIKGVTHQGWSDGSTWSRGQAWAIYGYTVVYRYTHNPMFLKFAEKVTDIYMEKLKKTSDDLIPVWDMDAPDRQVKDASAACVIASALLELQGYVEPSKQRTYREFALQSLAQLCTDKYLSGKKNVSFLLHSTGHHPAGSEIDASIIYADYYFIEALLRAQKLEKSTTK